MCPQPILPQHHCPFPTLSCCLPPMPSLHGYPYQKSTLNPATAPRTLRHERVNSVHAFLQVSESNSQHRLRTAAPTCNTTPLPPSPPQYDMKVLRVNAKLVLQVSESIGVLFEGRPSPSRAGPGKRIQRIHAAPWLHTAVVSRHGQNLNCCKF